MYYLFSLLSLLATFIFFSHMWMKRKYAYWFNLAVKTLYPKLFYGNYKDFIFARCSETDIASKAYLELDKEKYGGLYFLWKPLLVVKDPELIKRILVKDFISFPNHPTISDIKGTDSVLKSIFFVNDNEWRNRRYSMSHLFGTGNLKKMKSKVEEVCEQFALKLEALANQGEDIQLLNFMENFSDHIIASALIGIPLNKISEFVEGVKNISTPDTCTFLRSTLYRILPSVHRVVVKTTMNKKIWQFFSTCLDDIMSSKIEDSTDEADLLGFLRKCQRNEIKRREGTALEDMVGHTFTLFNANDPLSNTICLALFELSRKPDIQARLRAETDETLKANNGQLLYDDSLKSNTVMNNVLKETMRMYPTFGVIKRVSKENYQIDDKLTIPKDMEVLIPWKEIHNDSQYFEKPSVFNPDRFMNFTSPMWMPFGIGPRQCLGKRFAVMAMKLMLSNILIHFEILPSAKTEGPIQFLPWSILTTNKPKDKVWVKVRKLQKDHKVST